MQGLPIWRWGGCIARQSSWGCMVQGDTGTMHDSMGGGSHGAVKHTTCRESEAHGSGQHRKHAWERERMALGNTMSMYGRGPRVDEGDKLIHLSPL